ncbi:MAG: substrate-binding domain-containing protein [Magnetococcales bacterium]|nr:substrate-binding domain-containing protein [Magnetococcales bacterium]
MSKFFRNTLLTGVAWLGILGFASAGEPNLIGPAFSDPNQTVPMPEAWVKRGIEYDTEAKKAKADIAITLDQQIFLMLGKQIAEYGKQKGLDIVNQEGTCGISDGFVARKQVDLAGYCCAPDAKQRLPGLKHITLGIAAKVFITHPDNPVNDLTLEQIRKIYLGDYNRWSEIPGLQGAPNRPIHVVGRLHCKARPGHWRLLLDTDNLFTPRMKEVSSIPDMVSEVMAKRDSIGYETFTNILHYQKNPGPKFLRVEGQDPHDQAAIATLRYPIYRTFALTIWEDKAMRNPHVDGLVDFMLEEVEKLGPEHGFVAVSRLREAGWRFHGEEVMGHPPQPPR